MISEEIINNLRLIKTDKWFGQSFIHNCPIFEWPKALGEKKEKVFISDCDILGKPLKGGRLGIFIGHGGRFGYLEVNAEMLEDLNNNELALLFEGAIRDK